MDGLGSTKGNMSFAGFRSSSSILNKIGSNELLDASDGSVASRDESIGEDNNVPTSNGGTTNEGKTDSASLSWYGSVCMGPPDPILGLTEAYNRDTNKMKVNLGVGAYRDDNGKPFVLPSVRKVRMAEEILVEARLDKEYAGIAGIPQFCDAAVRLAFGADHPVLTRRLNATVQSVSGTGALRLAAAFFCCRVCRLSSTIIVKEKFHQGPKVVWVPNPTWNNHGNILRLHGNSLRTYHTGLGMHYYRYYDPKTCGIDESGLIDDLTVIPRRSIILLHVCAHNPTGVDLNTEQWLKVSEIIRKRELFPWFDMAYQGFATGDLDRDAYPVRLFLEHGHQLALAQSFAKNMGLYGERVGALTFVGSQQAEAQCILSQLKILIRPMISNPPIHGARITHLILTKPDLKQQWLQDLKVMTNRIMGARRSLKDCLEKEGSSRNWQHIVDQIGMFCYSGLSEAEVNRLIKDYSIYLTKDGRISVAGISTTNVQYLARAIHEVTNVKNKQNAASVSL
ncbi:aspartate aminotransferase [Trichuris trichiura]|uniref:Aspartate aminotransferase n=1 Tax=Trichuris trichiura TaxID=36087 RepID=A0A077Z7I2_TRITR|nr:aspartate aminotransferase [Trichuris trichiura]